MKKLFAGASMLLALLPSLVGCTQIGSKSGSPAAVYGATAVLSFVLLVGCAVFVRRRRFWFLTLFFSVLVVNSGYTLLAVSSCLEMALWANRLSYLGSVFLPLSMLMIILDVTGLRYKKYLPILLGTLSLLMLLITASPGFLPIYYKEVSFAVVDGVSTLVKVYGPLHPLYLVYLFGYFFAMVGVIVCARVKKTIASTSSAVIVAIAVFVNICVWFAEQLVAFDFEMLSVSYIISELFLLGARLVMNENSRLQEIVKKVETAQSYPEREEVASEDMLYKPIEEDCVTPDRIEAFVKGFGQLTPTERRVFEAYVARVTTKELLSSMDIKESTLKFHNRNLYGKLGVSNRKELLELHKHVKHTKILLEEKGKAPLDKDL